MGPREELGHRPEKPSGTLPTSSMAHISEEKLSFQFPENLSPLEKTKGMFFSFVNFPVFSLKSTK